MKKVLLIPLVVVIVIACSSNENYRDASNHSDAVYFGVVGNTHKIELDAELDQVLSDRAAEGDVYLIQNRTKENAKAAFYLKNFNGDEVLYEFSLPLEEVQYFLLQTADNTNEVSVSHGAVKHVDNFLERKEILVYQNDSEMTLEMGGGKSISKSSIRIFNPITTDQKILVEWVSQNQDFNDQILDNYFEGDVAIDILSGYPENVRYFYFEFDVAEDGEGT
jgi:uncharacterized protein YcfL